MAKTDVWMPIYIGDYLADTARLTTVQHGAYMLLIMDYWRNGPPPDDDVVLAQIVRMSPDAWSIIQAQVKHLFSIDSGVLKHKRIDEELIAARENKNKSQAKAKAAADARWGNSDKNASSIPQAMPEAMLEECPSPSPIPLTIKAKSKTKPSAAPLFDIQCELSQRGVSEQTASDWLAHRKKKRASVTKTALANIIAQAEKASMSLERVLSLCCARGWTGFEAAWVERDKQAGGKAGQPSQKFNFSGVDRSGDQTAQAASMAHHGVIVPEGEVEI